MYGTYQALLAPVNKKVSGHINGAVNLVRERNEFVADVRFSGGPASTLHTQNLHIGDRCPTETDDLNADGFIDAEEAAEVYKEILIPLDDDLSSQWMGLGIFPAADDFGHYTYSRATDFQKLVSDLRDEDINLADDYVKLSHNKSINVSGMVVVILGVPEKTQLPETVGARGRLTRHQSLPIACGVIRKLEKTPGVIDTDWTGIPVPAGETIGGSSGADDGADFNASSEDDSDYGEDDVLEDPLSTNVVVE